MADGGSRLRPMAARLSGLPWSRLSLAAGNLVPLAGVAFWGWDAFLLLILYWMETVVVAFWTFVRMARPEPPAFIPGRFDAVRRFFLPPLVSALYSIHTGIFIAAHLGFLWVLFSGDWDQRTGGLAPFLYDAVLREGLWVPLVLMFFAHGAFIVMPMLTRLMPRLMNALTRTDWSEDTVSPEGALSALTGRIFIMQIVIIFGGWFAMTVGSLAPLMLLVLAKTVVDWHSAPEPRPLKVADDVGRYRIVFTRKRKH